MEVIYFFLCLWDKYSSYNVKMKKKAFLLLRFSFHIWCFKLNFGSCWGGFFLMNIFIFIKPQKI